MAFVIGGLSSFVGFVFVAHVGRQLVISRVHKLCMAYLWQCFRAEGGGSNCATKSTFRSNQLAI